MATQAIDQAKFEALFGTALTHIGGAVSLLIAYMGDRLGLYAALAKTSPGNQRGGCRRRGN